MTEEVSAVAGSTVEWRLLNGRRGEERTYTQTDLSIEGEARLIGLARKAGLALADAGYTFGELGQFFEEGQTDWGKALDLIASVAQYAPDLIADAMTVFFGIFPTNEDGSPNAEFDDHRVFLRGAVNIARVEQIIRVSITQNEYARLMGPFGRTLAETMDAFAVTPASASSDPSEPHSIVGSDGSALQLEPETSEMTSTTAPSTSATETPSARSTGSRKRATATRASSGGA